MKNTVLRYGIWSALSIFILFLISSLLLKGLDFNTQEIYGYASIIISLSFVFFGIKHFRDTKNHGLLSFGKGLSIGLLITLFASITFGIYNVVYVEFIDPNFMAEYYNHLVEQVSKTLSGAELQAKLKQMEEEKDMFANPFMNFSLMFLTVFMIGLIISLISSLILQNKNRSMTSEAKTPEEYISQLPEEQKEAILSLRKVILDNLPSGYEEQMSYGMLAYVVPHSLYPAGYHCKPDTPLPFMNLASRKNFVAVYHMGIYSDKELMDWFINEYPKYSNRKLDMGKSCIRFKKIDEIPYQLIGELASKLTTKEWIRIYENAFKNNRFSPQGNIQNDLIMKKKVTGIGGLFFKTDDPKATKNWYKKHLGFNTDDWGCTFWWKDKDGNDCSTQWSPFKNDTDYFKPSQKDFMFNYRVENLVALLEELKKEGVTVIDKVDEYEYGKFGWIVDLDGNKIELWEPVDTAFK